MHSNNVCNQRFINRKALKSKIRFQSLQYSPLYGRLSFCFLSAKFVKTINLVNFFLLKKSLKIQTNGYAEFTNNSSIIPNFNVKHDSFKNIFFPSTTLKKNKIPTCKFRSYNNIKNLEVQKTIHVQFLRLSQSQRNKFSHKASPRIKSCKRKQLQIQFPQQRKFNLLMHQ